MMAETRWQRIATAPKDGTHVLAFDADTGTLTIATFCRPSDMHGEPNLLPEDFDDSPRWHEHYGAESDFTHWMPLPDPPARAAPVESPEPEEERDG